MVKSGYILAGFETLATIVDNFFKGKRGRWNDNFTRDGISHFLSNINSGFLHSYGQDFPGKKKYDKYNEKETELFTKCRDMRIFDGCTLIADSGGFQISIGKLTRRESELLFDMYYEWLEESYKVYDKAFILDIPPGPGCEIFRDFKDVHDWNLSSYQRAVNLPDHVREKIIYVHHFRTPKLWEIYTRLLRENDFFRHFEYHGCGGVVANMSGDMSIPCVIYVLPLIPLINEAIKHGRNYLNFHILGGANFRDILFYELFKTTVKNEHNIDLNITYDSSGIYKQVMHARFVHVTNQFGHVKKMNIKSDNLHTQFNEKKAQIESKETVEEMLEKVLNDCARKYGFKEISVDGVYDDTTNTFHEDVKVYSILYTLDIYSRLQEGMRKFATESYSVYQAGNVKDFNEMCLQTTKILNQGKITKKQRIKSHSISKSLDMLRDLDEDYCKYIVGKSLSKDEFVDLEKAKDYDLLF
jgi:hypothetical protein